MKHKPHPSQERLHERLKYCADNISKPLVWKKYQGQREIGAAGSLRQNGYYTLFLDAKVYRLHRLVWIYHYGDIPDGILVDHIDGNKANNRIENLRLATNGENVYNSKIRSTNISGVKGVYWDKEYNRWRARISINKKLLHLGRFDTIEEAKAAVIAARNNLHGDFARHE
jgi:hypothetical protein